MPDNKLSPRATVRFALREAMSLETLFELMQKRKSGFPGRFALRKRLLGPARIKFDVFLTIQPVVSVRDDMVIVRRKQVNSSIPVFDAEGSDITGGQEYFTAVYRTIEDILKNYR